MVVALVVTPGPTIPPTLSSTSIQLAMRCMYHPLQWSLQDVKRLNGYFCDKEEEVVIWLQQLDEQLSDAKTLREKQLCHIGYIHLHGAHLPRPLRVTSAETTPAPSTWWPFPDAELCTEAGRIRARSTKVPIFGMGISEISHNSK